MFYVQKRTHKVMGFILLKLFRALGKLDTSFFLGFHFVNTKHQQCKLQNYISYAHELHNSASNPFIQFELWGNDLIMKIESVIEFINPIAQPQEVSMELQCKYWAEPEAILAQKQFGDNMEQV